MKKLFSVVLVALFLMVGFVVTSEAISNFAADNAQIRGTFGGKEGISPAVVPVRVRYARIPTNPQADETIASGDVLVWDTSSADGITISRCIVDSPNDTTHFAGVAITTIPTADSTTIRASDKCWGWMAVSGYCLAKCDTSDSTTGEKLALGGATLEAAFQTAPTGTAAILISEDIGVLLTDTGADGLMRVFLR